MPASLATVVLGFVWAAMEATKCSVSMVTGGGQRAGLSKLVVALSTIFRWSLEHGPGVVQCQTEVSGEIIPTAFTR